MTGLYLDLFGGVAGDMLVAGLLDAGAPEQVLTRTLASLPQEFDWRLERTKRHTIDCQRFIVTSHEGHVHRHLSDVGVIIAAADLSERARGWANAAFGAIADAEAKCHATTPEQVQFHEVGAIDALVDICGACALLDALDPDEIYASPVAVGSGFVTCAHGRMPIPAPGTLRLLEGMPVSGQQLLGERATPTGVALLRAWEVKFTARPPAVPICSGHGAGARDPEDAPNFLRVWVERHCGEGEQLSEIRCLVDDLSGEILGDALEQLHATEGVIEAFAQAALAKKGRPAFEVVILVESPHLAAIQSLAFRLLGTLGMRVAACSRVRRPRRVSYRDTVLGELAFKEREDEHGGSRKPEFEALRTRAAELGLTPREAAMLLAAEDRD